MLLGSDRIGHTTPDAEKSYTLASFSPEIHASEFILPAPAPMSRVAKKMSASNTSMSRSSQHHNNSSSYNAATVR